MRKFLLLLRMENTEEENNFYIKAITQYGGEVLLVRDTDTKDELITVLEQVEGILLPGGNDVGKWDYFLIDYAVSHHLKLFGICQGMQSMALWKSNRSLVFLDNDLHHQMEGYVHSVELEDSKFEEILGTHSICVNSYHYQTVENSSFFKIVGKSSDGLIEVVENSDHIFQIGVQWHPERMLEYDLCSRKLFSYFVSC